MESKTKIKVDEGRIRRLVERNFGSQVVLDTITPLDNGMMNSVYLLSFRETVRGCKEMVLKLSFGKDADVLSYEAQIMRAEVEVYQKLERKDIPIPKLICYDFSQRIIECDCFFTSKIDGVLWSDVQKEIRLDNLERLKKELGRYNAVIHSVKNDCFGYIKEDRAWCFDTWSSAFGFMMDKIMEDGRKRGYDLPYESIRQTLNGYKDVLDEVKEPRLVDFDLWAGNVLLRKEEGEYRISGIIDFERAYFGDPYADFIASFGIYEDIETESAFIDGYSEEAGSKLEISYNDKIRMKLYRIYMDLLLAIETYRFDDAYRKHVLENIKIELPQLLNSLNENLKCEALY